MQRGCKKPGHVIILCGNEAVKTPGLVSISCISERKKKRYYYHVFKKQGAFTRLLLVCTNERSLAWALAIKARALPHPHSSYEKKYNSHDRCAVTQNQSRVSRRFTETLNAVTGTAWSHKINLVTQYRPDNTKCFPLRSCAHQGASEKRRVGVSKSICCHKTNLASQNQLGVTKPIWWIEGI